MAVTDCKEARGRFEEILEIKPWLNPVAIEEKLEEEVVTVVKVEVTVDEEAGEEVETLE